MASLRRLRRRLLRWERYMRHYPHQWWIGTPPGHDRAASAVADENRRRFWAETRPIRLTGQAWVDAVRPGWLVEPDDNRCCGAGDNDHPGPCVTTCLSCGGDGRCPDCGGIDDLGCGECGGSLSCPDCGGEGEHVEDVYISPRVVTEHAFADRGLL